MLPAALLALLGSGAAAGAAPASAGAAGAGVAGATAGGGIASLAPQLMELLGGGSGQGQQAQQPAQQPAYIQQSQSKGLQGLGNIFGLRKILGFGA